MKRLSQLNSITGKKIKESTAEIIPFKKAWEEADEKGKLIVYKVENNKPKNNLSKTKPKDSKPRL